MFWSWFDKGTYMAKTRLAIQAHWASCLRMI